MLNVTLKPLDTSEYPCWWNDKDTSYWMLHGSVTRGPEYNQEYYNDVKNSRDTKVFKILVEDKHVGNVSLSHIDWIHRRGELGIVIWDSCYRSKGVGTSACSLLCSYAFNILGLTAVWLGVVEGNTGAIKCYEKVGFKQCGKWTKAAYLHGVWHNTIMMENVKDGK